MSLADRFASRAEPETRSIPLEVATGVYPTGLNSAISRSPRTGTSEAPLIEAPQVADRWKPTRPRVLTVGLTFPAGLEFVPPKTPVEERHTLRSLLAPGAHVPGSPVRFGVTH